MHVQEADSLGDEDVEEVVDDCRPDGECGSDAVQRSGRRDGRAPILSDSRIEAADRGAREGGRCALRALGAARPGVKEAGRPSAAPPSPQALAVLGVGSWAIPGRPSPGARASSGEAWREPGSGSFGSAPNDLLPGIAPNLTPPAAAGAPAVVMGGGKRSVSHSPPSRAAAAGGASPRRSPGGDVCRGGGVRGEDGGKGGCRSGCVEWG
eukprot:scaffold132308_cov66-Phaeocystis_antarctica.AAC.1